MLQSYKGIPTEEYRALVQDKKKAVLELLKGINFEQIDDTLELVKNELEEIKSQLILH